ncbi:MAG: hypothetical protein HY978_03685 [Candidatus Liptonbacteria bacterium]|nr:hypothetical protein [Candidatus Liptonbacteria bacterium]
MYQPYDPYGYGRSTVPGPGKKHRRGNQCEQTRTYYRSDTGWSVQVKGARKISRARAAVELGLRADELHLLQGG